jgi:peptide/nickel transport system permease protein
MRSLRSAPSFAWLAMAFFLLVLLSVAGADFLTPYAPGVQERRFPFAPPTRIRFVDADWRFRPFVYELRPASAGDGYEEDPQHAYPLELFTLRCSSPPGNVVCSRHLFGVAAPARIFVLGTDGLGRDQFSRLLHGGRVSLLAGMTAAVLALGIGLLVGSVAGFYGGRIDAFLTRGSELVLALPALYLLLAVRAVLPLDLGPAQAFLVISALIGLLDWGRTARLVRGIVLSVRERPYVKAAWGFGASDAYLLRRHILPETRSALLVQGALTIPRYVVAEVTLSFLGLGVGEPVPSWGNMLSPLQQYHVLTSHWWMWSPAVMLAAVSLACFSAAEAIRTPAPS